MRKKILAALFGLAMIAGVATPLFASGSASAEPAPEVTICHHTGSESNPFVIITISENGLNGHDDHQDGADTFVGDFGCFRD